MRTYSLDAKAAKQVGTSNYITDTGKYIGTFTRAECVMSTQDTEGVEFDFKSVDGRTVNYLQLWTHNSEGKEIYGGKVLSAIMACLRVRTMMPKPMDFTKFDGSRYTADGLAELMTTPIGVLLQREEYEKRDGGTGFKFNIVAPFEAKTELTAAEILDKKSIPEQLAKMAATLHDRVPRAQKPAKTAMAPVNATQTFNDMDDDIPF